MLLDKGRVYMKELRIGDMQVSVPIIQGGMGVAISLSGLASAVANEGGIGVISAVGIGMKEPDYLKNFKKANIRALRSEIQKARYLSDGIIGVNIMLAASDFDDLLKTAIDEGIDIVFVGAGLPLRFPSGLTPDVIKKSHTKFVPKISSPKAAALILKYWDMHFDLTPDAFALEGPLAGGHLGFKKQDIESNEINLSSLVEQTVDIIKPYEEKYQKEIPVIAAGGIYSGKDIYSIMQHGAKAVKMGTRFVTTYECDASLEFKESYINSSKKDLTIIDSPVGLPGRAIKNNFIDEVNSGCKKPFKCYWKCLKSCDYQNVSYCIAQALFNAARGNMSEGFAFAGAKAYMAERLQSVKETIDNLIAEYEIYEKINSFAEMNIKELEIA
jgi:nitronate monooxygenase